MRIIIILAIIYNISCSPLLVKKECGRYYHKDNECRAEIEFFENGKFVYTNNCLGIYKELNGLWKITGSDTILLTVTPEYMIEKVLSSSYMSEFPANATFCGRNFIKLGKMKFKRI